MQNKVKVRRQAGRTLRETQLALEAAEKELAVLRESEERYRLISEVVANLTYTYRIEADGSFVRDWMIEKAARQATGFSCEEIDQRGGWPSLVHPEDRPQLYQHYEALLANEISSVEYRLITKSGEIRWIRDFARPRWDEAEGRVTYVYGASRDISERKQAEKDRQEAEALRNVAAILNTTLNLEEVLDRILASVQEVVPHEAANIMLIEAGVARIVRSRGYDEHGLHEAIQSLRFSVAQTSNLARIARSKQPLVISDTWRDPDWIFGWVRSYIGAPIRLEAEVIGFLNLDSTRPGAFNGAQAERLQAFADQAAVAIENARLYADSEQRANRLKVLHSIDQAILTAQSPRVIAQTALRQIQNLVPYWRGSITLFDSETQKARMFVVQVEDDRFADTDTEIPLEEIQADLKALKLGDYYMVEDITALADPSPLQRRRLTQEGIRSHLNLPLISQGTMIGSLNLAHTQPGPWEPRHIEIAREVADQLAIALLQARLHEQVRHHAEELEERVADRTRQLTALYEVTAVASEALNLEVTLERSLERVLGAMRSQAGAIHLLNESGETLSLAVQQGLPAEVVAHATHISARGMLGWVIEQGEPLIVADVQADLRLTQIPNLTIQAFISVPLRARGRVLGILSVTREKGQPPFNEAETALLTSIAGQVGVVVESAWLRQQAEQTAVMKERARLARDLHDSVTQLLYSVNLFAAVGREAHRQQNWSQAHDSLVEVGQVAQQALKEMRLLVYQLRPPALEHEGLIGALQQRLDAVEGRAGVKARLLADKMLSLPGPVEEALYHITQEALNNTLKHAGATSVSVQIQAHDHQLQLEIRDDGAGFEPSTAIGKGGMGLVSIRERIDQLGGVLAIDSAPGEGTTIKVSLEIPEKVP